MKTLLVTILSTICFNTYSQSILLYGGGNINQYFNWHVKDQHISKNYSPNSGFNFGIMYNAKLDSKPIEVGIELTQYNGYVLNSYIGLGINSISEFDSKKYAIGIFILPIKIKIEKDIFYSIGLNAQYLISSQTIGYYSSTIAGKTKIQEINNTIKEPKLIAGIVNKFQIQLKLQEGLFVVPQLNLYLGIGKEFENTDTAIHSARGSLNLGISKSIRKRKS